MIFQPERDRMAFRQIRARGVSDVRVLAAFRRVPRHRFVPTTEVKRAYDDAAVPIGEDQTISQPYMVALATTALRIRGGEKVLEVGSGSGYQVAILAELGARVIGVERQERLAKASVERLALLGYKGIRIVIGDGSGGLPEEAPFDRILLSCGAPRIPEPLVRQLAPDGIVVAPVGDRWEQTLVRVTLQGENRLEESLTRCSFVPLLGRFGWESGGGTTG